MNALEIVITITGLVEAGLAAALLYRSIQSDPEPAGSHPHFKVQSKKFYYSKQRPDGTWEIG